MQVMNALIHGRIAMSRRLMLRMQPQSVATEFAQEARAVD
jgi:hypothetical protein